VLHGACSTATLDLEMNEVMVESSELEYDMRMQCWMEEFGFMYIERDLNLLFHFVFTISTIMIV